MQLFLFIISCFIVSTVHGVAVVNPHEALTTTTSKGCKKFFSNKTCRCSRSSKTCPITATTTPPPQPTTTTAPPGTTTTTTAPCPAASSPLSVVGYTAKSGPLTCGCDYDRKRVQKGGYEAYVGQNSDPDGTYGIAIAVCKERCDSDPFCRVFGVEENETIFGLGPDFAVACIFKAGNFDPALVDCTVPASKFLVLYEKDLPNSVQKPNPDAFRNRPGEMGFRTRKKVEQRLRAAVAKQRAALAENN